MSSFQSDQVGKIIFSLMNEYKNKKNEKFSDNKDIEEIVNKKYKINKKRRRWFKNIIVGKKDEPEIEKEKKVNKKENIPE